MKTQAISFASVGYSSAKLFFVIFCFSAVLFSAWADIKMIPPIFFQITLIGKIMWQMLIIGTALAYGSTGMAVLRPDKKETIKYFLFAGLVMFLMGIYYMMFAH